MQWDRIKALWIKKQYIVSRLSFKNEGIASDDVYFVVGIIGLTFLTLKKYFYSNIFQINFVVNSSPFPVEPIVPSIPFSMWPPTCCFTLFGCTAASINKYCPPCPNNCEEINKCDCYFPGTKEIIKRRPVDKTPRPPFCCDCPQRECKNNCPASLRECSLENARTFIAL